jgi:tetratricopeptide (TPR) repeat protein
MVRRRPALPIWATPLLCIGLLGACGVVRADGLADVQELHRNGKTGEALKRLDSLLSAKPEDAKLRFERGVLLSDLKRNGDAIAVFVKLTQDHPELPEPHNNLAVLYAEAGQMDKAKASLEAAIRSKPNYGTAFQNLGDVYARMASRAYAKALQINEKDAASAPRLAMMRSLYDPAEPGSGTLVAAVNPAATRPAPPAVTPVPTANKPTSAAPVELPPAAKPATPAPTTSNTAQLADEARAQSAAADAERKKAATADAERKKAQADAERKKTELAEAKEAKAAKEAKEAREAEKAQEAKGAKDEREVLAAVRGWATAWTRQDMDGYFSRYEAGFSGGEGSAKAWQAARRARIMGKSGINISLSNVKIDVRGKEAVVSFRQTYEAGALKVSSSKRLAMVLVGGQWLIRKESVG